MSKLLFKLFDFRFVYFMRDTKSKRIKIGITTDIKRRKKEIESSSNKNLRVIFARKFFFAQKLEKRLHKKLEKQRKPFESGCGKTEFFKLTFLQLLCLRLALAFRFVCVRSLLFLSLIFITFIIIKTL